MQMSRRSRIVWYGVVWCGGVGGNAGQRDSRQSHDCVAARCEGGLAGKAVVTASRQESSKSEYGE